MAYFSSRVAIVGGGASGTLVAAHLLRQTSHPLKVLLYDAGALAKGVAYGTDDVAHLLNVPAGKMSALPDEPSQFLEWLNAPSNCASLVNGGKFSAGDFVPRAIYSRYLASVLETGIAEGSLINATFEHRTEEVVDFIPGEGGGTLVTRSGDTEDVAHVVLALGNLPPRDPFPHPHPFFQSPRYFSNIWRSDPFEGMGLDDDLLVVGSGLTALDIIASLCRRGHRGKIFVTSRNGRLPHTHEVHKPYHDFLAEVTYPANLRGWVRLFRKELQRAAKAGINWRPVFDALRPHTQKAWRALDINDRKRFLRHARSFWECHRHRAAPTTGRVIEAARQSGQLEFIPGRIRDFEETDAGVNVSLQKKISHEMVNLPVSRVLNCIGPESNFRHHLNAPLIVNLMARGVLHPDPLFLGIEATAEGALIGNGNAVFSKISTLGPPLRGVHWETTAIPEIRVQAEKLATHILKNFEIPAWQI